MNKRTRHSRQRTPFWLHLYLAASVVLYLYTPFIDHALGFDGQSRPHTHIHVDAPEVTHHDSHDDDGHEEIVLCTLDLNAALTLLYGFYSVTPLDLSPQETVTATSDVPYISFITHFPLVATPPPDLL